MEPYDVAPPLYNSVPRLNESYNESCSWCYITKTYLCNFDPLKPHFYTEKTGVYWGIHYFSYFCTKTYIVGTR